jgi:hypothetical protein
MFKHRRFPVEIILVCVRWYCKYGISYRDLASRALIEVGRKYCRYRALAAGQMGLTCESGIQVRPDLYSAETVVSVSYTRLKDNPAMKSQPHYLVSRYERIILRPLDFLYYAIALYFFWHRAWLFGLVIVLNVLCGRSNRAGSTTSET